MASKKLKLSPVTINAAFGEEEPYKIGNETILIKRMALEGLVGVIGKVTQVFEAAAKQDIDFTSLGAPNGGGDIAKLMQMLVTEAPEVVSELSGVDVESINQLPVDVCVDLLSKCLEVNLRNKDRLFKSFYSLSSSFNDLVGSMSSEKPTNKVNEAVSASLKSRQSVMPADSNDPLANNIPPARRNVQ